MGASLLDSDIYAGTLTVLRTGRDKFAVQKGEHPQESGSGVIPCPAGFHCYGFANSAFEVVLTDVVLAEKHWRRSFDGPGFHLSFFVFRLDEELDVGIPPVDFGERTFEADAVVQVEQGSHVVMGPRAIRRQQDAKGNRGRKSKIHGDPPCRWLDEFPVRKFPEKMILVGKARA